MNAVLKKTGMGLFYVLFVLFSGEIILRGLAAVRPVYSIEMMKYASRMLIRSPELGMSHAHKPGARETLMGVELAFDSLGNRSRELTQPKIASEKRIFVLGSSISMGWGVRAEDVFTSVVERRLNESGGNPGATYSVVNAGIANFNTVYEVKLFKRQVAAVQPDMVVVNFFINDAEDDPVSTDNPILKHSYFLAFVYEQAAGLKGRLTGKSLADHYSDLYKDGQPSWERCKAAIQELKSLCESRKIPLLFMLTPNPRNLTQEGPYPQIYAKILAALRGMGISAIDTFPAFHEKYGKDPSPLWVAAGDPHPNKNGHALLADALYEYLVKNPI